MTMKETAEQIAELCKNFAEPTEVNNKIIQEANRLDKMDTVCQELVHKILYYSKKRKSESITLGEQIDKNGYRATQYSLNSVQGLSVKHSQSGSVFIKDFDFRVVKNGIMHSDKDDNTKIFLSTENFNQELLFKVPEYIKRIKALSETSRYNSKIITCKVGGLSLEINTTSIGYKKNTRSKYGYGEHTLLSEPIDIIKGGATTDIKDAQDMIKDMELCDILRAHADEVLEIINERCVRFQVLKDEMEKDIAPYLMMEKLKESAL